VLLIDLDDNGHTTFNLGYRDRYEGENHVQNVLLDGENPSDFIVPVVEDLDLFPSHEALEEVETNLKSAMASSQRLFRNVVDPLLGDVYDYIVVDTPANRGKINDNALFATKNLMVPLWPESGWMRTRWGGGLNFSWRPPDRCQSRHEHERIQSEYDEMLAEYKERIEKLERENDRLRDEYKERIDERREEHEREIKRLKRELEERVDQLEREHERQVTRLKDEYEERITELEEEHDEEIADLQEENERLQAFRDDLQRQLAATNRRVDHHRELVDYVEEQRSLEGYRTRREQMVDQAGMLTRWKWKFTGIPVEEPDENEKSPLESQIQRIRSRQRRQRSPVLCNIHQPVAGRRSNVHREGLRGGATSAGESDLWVGPVEFFWRALVPLPEARLFTEQEKSIRGSILWEE
jgi:hypothetical protein